MASRIVMGSRSILDYQAIASTDWSYLAGIYDGEGSICTHQSRPANKRSKIILKLRFVITNNSKDLLCSLCEQFGGAIYSRDGSKTTNVCYEWSIAVAWQIKEVYAGMLPYLRYKNKEARLCMEFLRRADRRDNKHHLLTAEEQQRRIDIIAAIRSIPGRRAPRSRIGNISIVDPIRKCVVCCENYMPKDGAQTCCSPACSLSKERAAHKQWARLNRESRNARRRSDRAIASNA